MALTPETYLLWNRIHDAVNFVICLTFLIIYIISFYYLPQFTEKCCNKNNTDQEISPTSPTISSTSSSSNTFTKRIPHRKKAKLDKPTVITSMIYISTYTFRYFLFCINWMVIDFSNDPKQTKSPGWYEFAQVTMDLCFVIAHGAFYLLMILRLNRAFNGTIYEFHKYIIYAFYFGLFVIVLIDILYFYIYERGHETRTHLFFTLVALDLVLGFILIYCFVHKLFKLVITQRETLLSLTNNSGRTDNELSDKQLYFIGLATKYALLCSIAIIFTNLQFSGWAIFFLCCEFTEYYGLQLFLNWAYDVVLFTEMYCIWLSYPFARNHYYKVCNLCHNGCKNVFAFCVNKLINKDIEKNGKTDDDDMKEVELGSPSNITPVDSD